MDNSESVFSEENTAEAFTEKFDENNKLLVAVKIFRRLCELERIEKALNDNKPIATGDKGKIRRAIIDNTINAYRRNEKQKLNDKKSACLNAINKLKEENANIAFDDITREKLKQMADDFFAGDNYGFRRTLFAMILCVNDDGDYIYGDDTLFDVSEVLFGSETHIADIKDKLFDNYHRIANGGFWERNKYIILGAGISLALITVLTPIALGGIAPGSAVITSCLAQIGHCAPGLVGVGMAKVTGLTLLGSALLGGGIMAGLGIDELVRQKRAKAAFKDLNATELAALLAMKATLVDCCADKMDGNAYKTELDECLNSLNDMRSDAEYMLIVEKTDAENSKKKIAVCNRFVDRLTAIVGI